MLLVALRSGHFPPRSLHYPGNIGSGRLYRALVMKAIRSAPGRHQSKMICCTDLQSPYPIRHPRQRVTDFRERSGRRSSPIDIVACRHAVIDSESKRHRSNRIIIAAAARRDEQHNQQVHYFHKPTPLYDITKPGMETSKQTFHHAEKRGGRRVHPGL